MSVPLVYNAINNGSFRFLRGGVDFIRAAHARVHTFTLSVNVDETQGVVVGTWTGRPLAARVCGAVCHGCKALSASFVVWSARCTFFLPHCWS